MAQWIINWIIRFAGNFHSQWQLLCRIGPSNALRRYLISNWEQWKARLVIMHIINNHKRHNDLIAINTVQFRWIVDNLFLGIYCQGNLQHDRTICWKITCHSFSFKNWQDMDSHNRTIPLFVRPVSFDCGASNADMGQDSDRQKVHQPRRHTVCVSFVVVSLWGRQTRSFAVVIELGASGYENRTLSITLSLATVIGLRSSR